MSFHHGIDGSEPVREPVEGVAGVHDEQRVGRGVLGTGTLACSGCDAPVALAAPAAPTDLLACPYCARVGRLHEFLSLTQPTRPARVVVRVMLAA